MNTRASGFQKVVQLADARQAYESGDVSAALTQIDTLLAIDPGFAAAQALRHEISASLRRRQRPNWTKTLRTMGKYVVSTLVAILAIRAISPLVRRYESACRQCPVPQVITRTSGDDIVVPAETHVQAVPASSDAPAPGAPEWVSRRLTHLHARPQWRAAAVDVPDAALLRDLGEGIAQLWIGTIPSDVDALFVGGEADQLTWSAWRDSLKSNAVIWRIAPENIRDDDAVTSAAATAGFVRHTRIAYARGYVAEQYALNRSTR